MTTTQERLKTLRAALSERILVLDGATGTAIQAMKLSAEDFGGPAFEGCNEHLVRTRPDKIRALHESYLKAGADIIETNSFGAGSMGPTTKTISLTGGITFDALCDAYQEQAEGLIEGGVDSLLLETVQG